MIRSYREVRALESFQERYDYLKLGGQVGRSTFGFDRYLNQKFYTSREWRQIRHFVIARDEACDLGVAGYEIHDKILIHHINPIAPDHIVHRDDWLLDPDNLITTTHSTHNAIHYGDATLLPSFHTPRSAGDTKLW